MLKHNKKRNIGLLNEFFARYMATAAVEFRFDDYEKADSLWKKHFTKGSELAKELALFESIANARLKDRNIALRMLNEAERVTKSQDQEKLDREKTALLHEINSQLNDPKFFERSVGNYRTNASIQILLNAWRSSERSPNFSQISHVQEKVVDFMVEEKRELPPIDGTLLGTTKEDIDQLVVNVFSEKVDERYSQQLNEKQKEILGLYVFANNNPQAKEKLVHELSSLREGVSKNIGREMSAKNQKSTKTKLEEVSKCLQDPAYDVDKLSGETISFYLAIAGLGHELDSE